MSNKHSFSHLVPYELSSPEFLKRLQCQDATEGEKSRLSCQVIGDPVPKVQWLKEDGTEILDTDLRYEISYSLETGIADLFIKSTLLSDEMSYKCVASNKYGTSKTIGVLVVKANKTSNPSSPSRTLRAPDSNQRSKSPLKNIDVPVSNLPTVKEENELTSSQSEEAIADILAHKLTTIISPIVEKNEGCKLMIEPPELLEVKEGEDVKICFNILGLRYLYFHFKAFVIDY